MPIRPVALYAEDEIALHALIGFWLEDAGFETRFAADGAEALAMIRADRPDVLITDAMMPHLTGDELVETIKSDPTLASLPIVMATAAASPLRVTRMMARGCHAVLGKPLDEERFVAAVRAAVASATETS